VSVQSASIWPVPLASYETTSALVTRSSPEMGMAPWHTPDWRFTTVSPPVQPWPESLWDKSPGILWFTQMPLPRVGVL
ncbi:hypothetical protein M9458_010718, partial [Cirrhinus mrigala]